MKGWSLIEMKPMSLPPAMRLAAMMRRRAPRDSRYGSSFFLIHKRFSDDVNDFPGHEGFFDVLALVVENLAALRVVQDLCAQHQDRRAAVQIGFADLRDQIQSAH